MDYIASPKETARLFQSAPGESKLNEKTLRRMCIDGKLTASRVGSRWYINVTKSFPELGLTRSEEVA